VHNTIGSPTKAVTTRITRFETPAAIQIAMRVMGPVESINDSRAPPAAPSRDTVFIAEQGEWMDVPRTKALWTEVFQAPKALIKRGDWIDQPSIGIPYLYIATGATLAQILNEQGDGAGARDVYGTTRQVAQAVRVESRGSVIPESLPAASPAAPATGDTRAPGQQLPVKTVPPAASKTKAKTMKTP